MILVTGGAGYVGSHFLRRFSSLDSEAEVIVIDNLCYGHKEALVNLDRCHFHNLDLGDKPALDALFQKVKIDAVVHFAAYCYVGESQEQPFKYFQNNVTNSINLFDCMQRHAVKRIIFSSSCATYGIPNYTPIDEAHTQKPVNAYGMTKVIVEQVLETLAQTLGWSYIALRYFNAAGADAANLIGESHSPETHLIPRVLQAAAGKLANFEIHGGDYDTPDGTCIRDYIHVVDLADAHIAALRLVGQKQLSEAINLGTAVGASVLEVIDLCRTTVGDDISVRVGPRRAGDPAKLVANYEKAERLLAWKPQKSLKEIVESAWNWEQNRRY